MLGSCFVVWFLVFFLVQHSPAERERELVPFLSLCRGFLFSVSSSRCVGWSAVCDCGIS